MNQASLVAVALVGLWIAYLVPHRLRYRQQLLEARTEDRFSDDLRVLRSVPQERTRTPRGPERGTAVVAAPRGPSRPYLHPPGRGGDGTMHRPHGAADRISADAARRAAAERARRVAHLSQRRAAARRRAVLTALLLVTTVGGWAAVGAVTAPLAVGVAPTVALLATLALGRRAVVAGRRADAAWEVRKAELVALPQRSSGVVGRAVHPSEATTEVMGRVPRESSRPADRAEPDAPAREQDAVAATAADHPVPARPTATPAAAAEGTTGTTGTTWAPVPVPRPTYALKPSAPRPEPAPLVLDERPAAAPAAATAATPSAQPGATATQPGPTQAGGLPTGGSALDAVLARRRAAGE